MSGFDTPRLSAEAAKIKPETQWLGLLLITHWPEARILAATVNNAGAKINATIARSKGRITREHVAALIEDYRLTKEGERRTPRFSTIIGKLRDKARTVFDEDNTRRIVDPMLHNEFDRLGAKCLSWVRGLEPESRVTLMKRAMSCLTPMMRGWITRLDIFDGDILIEQGAKIGDVSLARYVAAIMADIYDGGDRVTVPYGERKGCRVADDEGRWSSKCEGGEFKIKLEID